MKTIQRIRERVRSRSRAVDEEYRAALAAERRERTLRHGLGTRVSHWLLVLLFFSLLATGLMMWFGWYGPIATDLYGGYYIGFGVHMWAGILLLAVGFILFPFYHVVVDGHNPIPTVRDLKDALIITAAFVGLRQYVAGYHRARRTWDERAGEWAAYHPAQKFFWWMQLGLFALLAATGFALYDRIATAPPTWVGWFGAPAAWLPPETQLQVHIFFALALTATVMLHIYFSVLPSNWDVLKSMVSGHVNAYVISDEDGNRPETEDESHATTGKHAVITDGHGSECDDDG